MPAHVARTLRALPRGCQTRRDEFPKRHSTGSPRASASRSSRIPRAPSRPPRLVAAGRAASLSGWGPPADTAGFRSRARWSPAWSRSRRRRRTRQDRSACGRGSAARLLADAGSPNSGSRTGAARSRSADDCLRPGRALRHRCLFQLRRTSWRGPAMPRSRRRSDYWVERLHTRAARMGCVTLSARRPHGHRHAPVGSGRRKQCSGSLSERGTHEEDASSVEQTELVRGHRHQRGSAQTFSIFQVDDTSEVAVDDDISWTNDRVLERHGDQSFYAKAHSP